LQKRVMVDAVNAAERSSSVSIAMLPVSSTDSMSERTLRTAVCRLSLRRMMPSICRLKLWKQIVVLEVP